MFVFYTTENVILYIDRIMCMAMNKMSVCWRHRKHTGYQAVLYNVQNLSKINPCTVTAGGKHYVPGEVNCYE